MTPSFDSNFKKLKEDAVIMDRGKFHLWVTRMKNSTVTTTLLRRNHSIVTNVTKLSARRDIWNVTLQQFTTKRYHSNVTTDSARRLIWIITLPQFMTRRNLSYVTNVTKLSAGLTTWNVTLQLFTIRRNHSNVTTHLEWWIIWMITLHLSTRKGNLSTVTKDSSGWFIWKVTLPQYMSRRNNSNVTRHSARNWSWIDILPQSTIMSNVTKHSVRWTGQALIKCILTGWFSTEIKCKTNKNVFLTSLHVQMWCESSDFHWSERFLSKLHIWSFSFSWKMCLLHIAFDAEGF